MDGILDRSHIQRRKIQSIDQQGQFSNLMFLRLRGSRHLSPLSAPNMTYQRAKNSLKILETPVNCRIVILYSWPISNKQKKTLTVLIFLSFVMFTKFYRIIIAGRRWLWRTFSLFGYHSQIRFMSNQVPRKLVARRNHRAWL